MSFEQIEKDMQNCEQTKGQTVWQHGQSVVEYLEDLLCSIRDAQPQKQWRLPEWFERYKHLFVFDKKRLLTYALYHDCGKPYCRVEDEKGVHFPNHAEVSKQTYLEAGGDEEVARLIGWDMVIHTASAEEIDRYCREEWDEESAVCLLLAALAEIHSNARMFGGIESTSFKIKWKQVEKRGRQICKFYFEKKE